MLVIRKEQMDMMSRSHLKQYFDNLERHLKNRYPEKTKYIGDELSELIIKGVDKAKGYNITDKNDIKRFLEYIIQYGKDFGESPDSCWAKQILDNTEWSGTLKMNKIDEYDLFVITLGKDYV